MPAFVFSGVGIFARGCSQQPDPLEGMATENVAAAYFVLRSSR